MNAYDRNIREAPNNVEIEQAFLGALFANNAVYGLVSSYLTAAHFYEPLHRKIFAVSADLINAGKVAYPVTVKTYLAADEVLGDMTVAGYLARLAAEAVTVVNAPDYARTIVDLADRRSLIVIGGEMVETAYDAPVDMAPRQIWRDTEAKAIEVLASNIDDGESSISDDVDAIIERRLSLVKKPTVPLPLVQLRDILGGEMDAGNLVGMLSASGEGKTSMALQVVDHAASLGHPVMILSFDQSKAEIIEQIVSQRTGIENTRIRNWTLQEREVERYFEALAAVKKLPLRIRKCNGSFDTAGHLVGYVKRSLLPLCRKSSLPGLVVLDHSRKVKPTDPKAHEGRIAADMNGVFKQAAGEMGLVWFNLMQRSGAGVKRKNPRPIDSDIFGGEMGREDYDAVFYLYRAWKYWKTQLATAEDVRDEDRINARFNREKWEEDEAELGVLKWRFGDPNRRFRVRFEAEYTRYVSKRPEMAPALFDEVA